MASPLCECVGALEDCSGEQNSFHTVSNETVFLLYECANGFRGCAGKQTSFHTLGIDMVCLRCG